VPILVTCVCGKQYRLKDHLAGRRAKCPACRAVMAIPGERLADEPPPAPFSPASSGAVPPARMSRALLFAGGRAGAVVLLAGLSLACYLAFRSPPEASAGPRPSAMDQTPAASLPVAANLDEAKPAELKSAREFCAACGGTGISWVPCRCGGSGVGADGLPCPACRGRGFPRCPVCLSPVERTATIRVESQVSWNNDSGQGIRTATTAYRTASERQKEDRQDLTFTTTQDILGRNIVSQIKGTDWNRQLGSIKVDRTVAFIRKDEGLVTIQTFDNRNAKPGEPQQPAIIVMQDILGGNICWTVQGADVCAGGKTMDVKRQGTFLRDEKKGTVTIDIRDDSSFGDKNRNNLEVKILQDVLGRDLSATIKGTGCDPTLGKSFEVNKTVVWAYKPDGTVETKEAPISNPPEPKPAAGAPQENPSAPNSVGMPPG